MRIVPINDSGHYLSRQPVLKHVQLVKLAGLLHVSEGFSLGPAVPTRCEGMAPLTGWLNALWSCDGGEGISQPSGASESMELDGGHPAKSIRVQGHFGSAKKASRAAQACR
jgi:hypothetical protein